MKIFLRGAIVGAVLSIALIANAVQIEFHSFENAAQEKLYSDLIAELRCVKCQNQNLAQSDAELARDMRDKAYEMIISGKNREDVVAFMTARYGDFVLYKPPFKFETVLLWVGPPVLLLLGLFLLLRRIRSQSKLKLENLSQEEQESIRDMLSSKLSHPKNGK